MRRGLLAALGFAVQDEAAIAESLAEVESLRRGLIPPLLPVEARRAARVPVRLQNGTPHTLVWRLVDERGTAREGRANPQGSEPGFELPPLTPGYHRLTVQAGQSRTEAWVIAAPQRCWRPRPYTEEGASDWGLAAQLYGLRSATNIGIGTYADAGEAAREAALRGAAFLGLSPVHALFASDRTKISPYSPSSRLFLETLFIAPRSLPGLAGSRAEALLAERADAIAALREAALVDHQGVHDVLDPVLRALWADSPARAGTDAGFERFRQEGGADLASHAVFEALSEHFRQQGAHWLGDWPEEFRRAGTEAVRAFAAENAERGRLPCLAAIPRRPAARRGVRGGARRRHAGRALSGPGGRRRPGRLRDLVASRALRRQGVDRRAAGPAGPQGPELGPAGLRPAGDGARRARGLPRAGPGQHAPRRRDPDRPRLPARPPVPDPAGRGRPGRRLRGDAVRADAGGAAAGEPPQQVPRHRRGSRHRARGLLRRADAGRGAELPDPRLRAGGRRPVQGRPRPIRATRSRRSPPTTCRPSSAGGAGSTPTPASRWASTTRIGPRPSAAERVVERRRLAEALAGEQLHPVRRAAGRRALRGRRPLPRPGARDADRRPVRGRGLRTRPGQRAGLDGGLPELAAQARPGPRGHRRPRRPARQAGGVPVRRGPGTALGRRAARRAAAALDLPAAVPQGLHLRGCGPDRPLPAPARDQPRLRLAAPEGAAGLDPRLRHRRPRRDQPGARRRGRLHPALRDAPRPRDQAPARHRPEPHGRRRCRQSVVALGARMGLPVAVRRRLRHRLAAARGRAQPRHPVPRRALRRGPGEGHAGAEVRPRHGRVQRLALRAPAADPAARATRRSSTG